MNYTPTPWEYITSNCSNFVHIETSTDHATVATLVKGTTAQKEANADFIVRACNNHQNLIERLAHAVWVMRSWAQAAQEGSDQYDMLHAEADNAEAALKLARGE